MYNNIVFMKLVEKIKVITSWQHITQQSIEHTNIKFFIKWFLKNILQRNYYFYYRKIISTIEKRKNNKLNILLYPLHHHQELYNWKSHQGLYCLGEGTSFVKWERFGEIGQKNLYAQIHQSVGIGDWGTGGK